jgi:hypothetical protein
MWLCRGCLWYLVVVSFLFIGVVLTVVGAAGRGAFFLLKHKRKKMLVSRNVSLPHLAMPHKADRTTGCNILPCFARSLALASAKFAMPLPALLASMF